jgi:hypothetical protein
MDVNTSFTNATLPDVDEPLVSKKAESAVNNSSVGHEYEYYFFDLEAYFSAFKFQLEIFLMTRLSIFIVVIAFIGNILIIIVLSRKRNRHFSTSIFISSLALADFFVILSLLEGWLMRNNLILAAYSDLDCKLRSFLTKTGQYASVWMLVAISIERALSVKLPLKVKTIFTINFARFYVILVWILSVAKTSLNASFIVFLTRVIRKPDCYVEKTLIDVYNIDLILHSVLTILPLLIIFVCTLITISSLLQNRLRKSKSNKAQIKSITITLLLVNLVYLFTVSPQIIHEIYMQIWINLNKYRFWTFDDYNNYAVLLNLFSFLGFLNHASNFFIYFLSGSRFRAETKELLLSCIKRK